MKKVFEQYKSFIETDPRIHRLGGYTITENFSETRHDCFFKNIDINDKTILDLGCCVGATGAWTLANKAKFYCGVEYNTDLAALAENNLSVFEPEKWAVVTDSAENFLENNTRFFDIIIASGLLYAFFEPIPILKQLSKIAETIIIESTHPFSTRQSDEPDIHDRSSTAWQRLMEEEPFIAYQRQAMVWGTNKEQLEFHSSVPSKGFVVNYLKLEGFDYDPTVYTELSIRLPEVYNLNNRYGVRMVKNPQNSILSQGFLDAATFTSPDVNIKKWRTK